MTATEPTLVVVRGNSGSGKTTAAREARRRYGRGIALLEQDHLRRIVLREHDSSHIDPVAPAFITATARTALDLGYHVILEGILHTERYAAVLHQLIGSHPGPAAVFYLDVSFDETVRRHLSRAEPIPVTPDEMRAWYAHRDLLDVPGETVIAETSTFEQTVTTILHTSGLTSAAPQTPCPRRCRHCARKSGDSAAAAAASQGSQLMPESVVASEVRTGGCLCGKVRFTVSGEPDYPHVCSCTHCQKRAGGPIQSWVSFPLKGLSWTGEGGEPTWFDTFPGETKRGFCAVCGSSVAAFDYGDTLIGINLSALDDQDDPRLVPVNQSFRDAAVSWLPQVPDTQHSTVS